MNFILIMICLVPNCRAYDDTNRQSFFESPTAENSESWSASRIFFSSSVRGLTEIPVGYVECNDMIWHSCNYLCENFCALGYFMKESEQITLLSNIAMLVFTTWLLVDLTQTTLVWTVLNLESIMLILKCHISILSYIYVRMISSDKVFLLDCCPDALHHITEIQDKLDLITNSIERAMNYSWHQEQQPFNGQV